jgi:hypothetical protein
MFIGSSTEGLSIARALHAELEHDVDPTVWNQGVFGLSQSGLEALENQARTFDFAVLVLTPDDLLTKRGDLGKAPRDNVLLEVGLFIGALGRHRVFLVSCRDDVLDLPSDLDGITRAQFNRRPDVRAAIGPAATSIRTAIDAAASHAAPVSRPGQDDARRRVLSLAHEVLTELETDRYQLDEAKKQEHGWAATDMLQAAKFDKWQKDPDAVAHTDVMDALRGTYIRLHRKNVEMQARERAEWNAVGGTLDEPGLTLNAHDLADLDEGMSRIQDAQDHLRRLCAELTGPVSTHRGGDTQPAESPESVVVLARDDEARSDAREAFAISIKPRLAVRTTFEVKDGKPTGEMFLEVHNASEWTADDIEVEVRYRDGRIEKDRRDRMNPDHQNEPRWTVLLREVKPASVDVFAEIRQRIESVALTYSDARHIARHRVQLATREIGDPFDVALGEEHRIE